MTRPYECGVRPAAIDHVFYDQMKRPSLNSVFTKSVYWGALARTVASFNPNYAFFYGFARGATDFITANVQYALCFEKPNHHQCYEDFLKALYVGVNFFGSMLIMYTICKVGELVYWGGKSLIGRADYRSFGILDLIKIEGMFTLFTIGIDLGLKAVDTALFDPKPSRNGYESQYHTKGGFQSFNRRSSEEYE